MSRASRVRLQAQRERLGGSRSGSRFGGCEILGLDPLQGQEDEIKRLQAMAMKEASQGSGLNSGSTRAFGLADELFTPEYLRREGEDAYKELLRRLRDEIKGNKELLKERKQLKSALKNHTKPGGRDQMKRGK